MKKHKSWANYKFFWEKVERSLVLSWIYFNLISHVRPIEENIARGTMDPRIECSGVHFSLDVLPSWADRTEDHVLTSAYVKIFRTVMWNAVNKSFRRKKNCSWLPLNKYAMNIWLSSLRIRAHLSWRTGKHLYVLHVLRIYPTCSHPGW